MKHCSRIPKAAVALALLLIALGGTALAQEEVTYTWTAPTSGSPVHHYVVQHSVNGQPYVTIDDDLAGTSLAITLSYEDEHVVRVAAVDSQGRQGPYSVPSDPYTPTLGAPGQPGKPIAVF